MCNNIEEIYLGRGRPLVITLQSSSVNSSFVRYKKVLTEQSRLHLAFCMIPTEVDIIYYKYVQFYVCVCFCVFYTVATEYKRIVLLHQHIAGIWRNVPPFRYRISHELSPFHRRKEVFILKVSLSIVSSIRDTAKLFIEFPGFIIKLNISLLKTGLSTKYLLTLCLI